MAEKAVALFRLGYVGRRKRRQLFSKPKRDFLKLDIFFCPNPKNPGSDAVLKAAVSALLHAPTISFETVFSVP